MMPPGDGLPLVSCIMPTYNRRRFVPSAIRYFLRQDFPNKELIIVDDGTDAIDDLVPNDPGVRYIRLSSRATVGAKRNLACEQSHGSLIAHWDDDDWHSPNRLRSQVEALQAADADLCGLKTLLFFDTRNGQAWRYAYPDSQPSAWLSGGSLLYSRDFWAGHRFSERNIGEDAHLVWKPPTRGKWWPYPDARFTCASSTARMSVPSRPRGAKGAHTQSRRSAAFSVKIGATTSTGGLRQRQPAPRPQPA